jgi:hypothetical protein
MQNSFSRKLVPEKVWQFRQNGDGRFYILSFFRRVHKLDTENLAPNRYDVTTYLQTLTP